jgi:predicted heme/steroid binding protein
MHEFIFTIEKREAFTGRSGVEYVVHAQHGDFEVSYWRTGRNLKRLENDIIDEYDNDNNVVIVRKF